MSVCVGSSDQWLCVARLPPSLSEEAFVNLASNYGKVVHHHRLCIYHILYILVYFNLHGDDHCCTVCQMGQCSDISATSVFQVKTSLSGFKRLWGDTRVMWTHFFTFWISGCVSEMAQKWSILGKNPQFSSLGATEAQDGW